MIIIGKVEGDFGGNCRAEADWRLGGLEARGNARDGIATGNGEERRYPMRGLCVMQKVKKQVASCHSPTCVEPVFRAERQFGVRFVGQVYAINAERTGG